MRAAGGDEGEGSSPACLPRLCRHQTGRCSGSGTRPTARPDPSEPRSEPSGARPYLCPQRCPWRHQRLGPAPHPHLKRGLRTHWAGAAGRGGATRARESGLVGHGRCYRSGAGRGRSPLYRDWEQDWVWTGSGNREERKSPCPKAKPQRGSRAIPRRSPVT